MAYVAIVIQLLLYYNLLCERLLDPNSYQFIFAFKLSPKQKIILYIHIITKYPTRNDDLAVLI